MGNEYEIIKKTFENYVNNGVDNWLPITENTNFEVTLPSSICVGDEVSIVYTESGIKDIQVTQDADYE